MSSSVQSEVVPRPGLLRWPPQVGRARSLLGYVALLGVLGEGVALTWWGPALASGLGLLLWGQWLALTVGLVVVGVRALFGPVFFYDLVRLTRRGRYFLIRVVYILALLFVIWVIWSNWVAVQGGTLNAAQMAQFANTFFFVFMAVQLGLVLLLTPAYAAGAIAEEKDRKTIEFVLATDLRDREIVLGKLASRVLNLLFVVLAGLPVLALMQFLGGVDPGLLAAGFAATALTMLSLGAVSILFSARVRRSRDAIVLAYLALLTYPLVAELSFLLLAPAGWAEFPTSVGLPSPVTLADVVEWFNAGNLIHALERVRLAYASPNMGPVLADVLGRYALVHGLLTLGCCAAAVWSVRRVALRDASSAGPVTRKGKRRGQLPAVGRRPMVWKEVFAERGLRLHWLGRAFVVVLVGASFLPLWFIWESAERFNSLDVLSEAMNAWVRGVGTAVACLMLLGVAVRASGGVSGERERQTFDALLTCPLESRDILAGKWLGSLLAMRWTWLWLGAIWLLGLVSGGLHPLALPLLALAWFAFAAFVAALGLWYSTVCPNTLRATLWTLFALVVVWAAHWLAWMCCIPVFIAMGPGGGGRELEQVLPRVAEFQAFTLTPPATLGFLAFRLKDFEHFDNYASTNWAAEWLVCALLGIAGWGAAAAVLRSATLERFDQVTGRRAVRRRPPPGR